MAARAPGLLFDDRRPVDIEDERGLLYPGPIDGDGPPQGTALRLKRPDGAAFVLVSQGKSVPSRGEPHEGVRTYPLQVHGGLPASEIPSGTEVWLVDVGG